MEPVTISVFLHVYHGIYVNSSYRYYAMQAGHIKNILNQFERGTGQLLSPAKCSVLTRESLDENRKEEIRKILGVERVEFEAKYLGLPTPDGRQKKDCFQPLRERLGKQMAAWSEKHLSAAAKEVLIKAVAQAIPTYTMSIGMAAGRVSAGMAFTRPRAYPRHHPLPAREHARG
jgi:hypothetical protein